MMSPRAMRHRIDAGITTNQIESATNSFTEVAVAVQTISCRSNNVKSFVSTK